MEKTRNCQACKQGFKIESEDFSFYEKMNAPAPTYCPNCRSKRRLVWRNERSLYRRSCDLCDKKMVAIYPDGTPFPVYCHNCWWSDKWNPKTFALDYDERKPFFEQFKELQNSVPRVGMLIINSVNSEYSNNSADLKNCYLIFAAENCEDSMYGRLVQNCRSVYDVAFAYDSERCYEGVDCHGCYNCAFVERCQSSTDLFFCFDARDSNHCILSTNIRHGSYLIENKPCSKEEFEAKKKEILSSRKNIEATKKRLEELKKETVTKFAYQTKCEKVTGDYLYNCHIGKFLFDVRNAKECAFIADAEDSEECYDCNNAYYKPERCLDVMGSLQSNNSKHCTFIFYSNEIEYSDNLHNCQSCFGCIGLQKADYCILNKQYSKEEYGKLKGKIIESMKAENLYGQYFPPEISPFGYNEAVAKDFHPLTKERAIKEGFKWQDKGERTTGKETATVPEAIAEADEEATKQIFACADCKLNFKITPQEFQFYKDMGIALPNKDFECRHQNRMRLRTPRELHPGKCQCAGAKSQNGLHENESGHFHKSDPCPNEFETAYSPDSAAIVYCKECYEAEVV